MFERFTDRARKMMQLANQAAQKMNHESIGTEHLLLGLIKQPECNGARILGRYTSFERIQKEIECLVVPGPEMVTMGKLPLTPRVKMIIERAITEARTLLHNYVGTEHLLLGMVEDEGVVAGQVLKCLGIGRDMIIYALKEILHEIAVNVVQDKPADPVWYVSAFVPAVPVLSLELADVAAQAGVWAFVRHLWASNPDKLVELMHSLKEQPEAWY